jgi:hypothetical protein
MRNQGMAIERIPFFIVQFLYIPYQLYRLYGIDQFLEVKSF